MMTVDNSASLVMSVPVSGGKKSGLDNQNVPPQSDLGNDVGRIGRAGKHADGVYKPADAGDKCTISRG